MVNNWLKITHNWLLPDTCILCDRMGVAGHDLCDGCAAELPYIGIACERCAIPLPAPGVCGQCQQSPPSFDAARALFYYREPLDQLIKGLKFGGKLHNARLLGQLMAERWQGSAAMQFDAIVPVPLHPARLRQRGFNQALELARPLAKALELPLLPQLSQRLRDTTPQLGQSAKARRRNLNGAFAVTMPDPASIRRVIVVDDVMTTGSTAELLAKALKQAGVEWVELWLCARADLPGRSD